MPCAAGSKCAVVPDHTPGPPNFTTHRCRVCQVYLHGICGLADPRGDNEMQRVCHGCFNPDKRNRSIAGSVAGAASSKRPCPEGEGTGTDQQSGVLGSLKRVSHLSLCYVGCLQGIDDVGITLPKRTIHSTIYST